MVGGSFLVFFFFFFLQKNCNNISKEMVKYSFSLENTYIPTILCIFTVGIQNVTVKLEVNSLLYLKRYLNRVIERHNVR